MNSQRNFMEMLQAQWGAGKFLAVGLDSDFKKIPGKYKSKTTDPYRIIDAFNTDIIWQTRDITCAYTVNDAFYKAHGPEGLQVLRKTVDKIRSLARDIPVLLNICAGDVGSSNLATIQYAFEYLGVDGITLSPYFGEEALEPFLKLRHKGIVILSRTSNVGAGEFQDLKLSDQNVPLHRSVAWRVSEYWNQKNKNCALLVGPMAYGELTYLREIVRELPVFVTGISQRGLESLPLEDDDIGEVILNGRNKENTGIVLCASRSIIFAENPQEESLRVHKAIQQYRSQPLVPTTSNGVVV